MALDIGYTCYIVGPFMEFQHLTTFDCLYKLLLWSSAVPEQIYYFTLDNEAILCSGTAKDQHPRLYDYLKVLANLIFGLSVTCALGFIMSFPGIPTYICYCILQNCDLIILSGIRKSRINRGSAHTLVLSARVRRAES